MLCTNLFNFYKPNLSCCLFLFSRWQLSHSEHWTKTVDLADKVAVTWGKPQLDEVNHVEV